jgi:hypothetical protein
VRILPSRLRPFIAYLAAGVLSLELPVCGQAGSDACATATQIVGCGPFVFDTCLASTGTEGQAEGICSFGSTAIEQDVWFVWTASLTGTAEVSLCGQTAADSKVAVYLGAGCPASSALACNDDYCGAQSRLTFATVMGQPYTLQIGNSPGTPCASGTFIVCAVPPPPPPPSCSPVCTDFDDAGATTQGWQFTTPAGVTMSNSGAADGVNGHFLVVHDLASPPAGSPFVYNDTFFPHDWTERAQTCEERGESATLEFDVRISTDGDGNNVQKAKFLMGLAYDTNGPGAAGGIVASAIFVPSFVVNEASGWVHVVAPIPFKGSLCNSFGCWQVTGDWGTLLDNVSYLQLPVEIGPGLETWHWDNICLNCCDRCPYYHQPAFTSAEDSYHECLTGPKRYKDHDLDIVSAPTARGFTARYANVTLCDVDLGGNTEDHPSTSDYQVSFEEPSPIGTEWAILVNTHRKGELTLVDDTGSPSYAEISPVSGTLAAKASLEGSLNLPGHTVSGGNGQDQPFDDSAVAVIKGTGPQDLALRFHWYSLARSGGGVGGGDGSAIRLGVDADDCGGTPSTAGDYPGENNRDRLSDGHFVKVECIECVDDYCHDFNGDYPDPASPEAVGNWTTTGPILQPIFNPGTGGAPPPPAGAGSGYLHLVDGGGSPGLLLHGPEDLRGKWDCFCGSFEFDIRIFDDGASGHPNFHPTLSLERNDGTTAPSGAGALQLSFTSSVDVNENSGWVHVTIPLPPGIHPVGPLGAWNLPSAPDLDWILTHVTDVRLPGEFTSGPDIVGYDNFCLVENHDCVHPPSAGNLVGWWPFDDTTMPLHDIASQRPTDVRPTSGALGGAPSFANSPAPVAGAVGGGLEFDGRDDFVVVPASTSSSSFVFARGDFTIDAWIKSAAAGNARLIFGEQPIVDKRTNTTTGSPPVGYRLFLSNGYLAMGVADRDQPGESICFSSTPFLGDGLWHHVTGTVTRSPGRIKLYVDCAEVASCPLGKVGWVTNAAADLYIGGGHAIGGPATFFRGRIDEVEIFRGALSSDEICEIFNASCAGKCKQYCYARPYQTILGASGIKLTVCNGTAEPQLYSWSIADSSCTASCTISGLGFTPSSGSVLVAAWDCETVTLGVIPPPGMTTSSVACYEVALTNTTDPQNPLSLESCCGSLRWCDIVICPAQYHQGL